MEDIGNSFSKVLEYAKSELESKEEFLLKHIYDKEKDFQAVFKYLREIEATQERPFLPRATVIQHLTKRSHLLVKDTLEKWLVNMKHQLFIDESFLIYCDSLTSKKIFIEVHHEEDNMRVTFKTGE